MRAAARLRFRSDLIVGDDARDEALVLRFVGVEDAALQQDLERHGGTHETHERRHLRVRHHEPQVLDRRAKSARRAANPQIAQRGDLQSAAHTDAVDLRDQRMAARGERLGGRAHHRAVGDGLRLVRALAREFTDVVPGRKRFLACAAQDDAADVAVRGQRAYRQPQVMPHRFGQRVELVGAVEHDRCDGPIPRYGDRLRPSATIRPWPDATDVRRLRKSCRATARTAGPTPAS